MELGFKQNVAAKKAESRRDYAAPKEGRGSAADADIVSA